MYRSTASHTSHGSTSTAPQLLEVGEPSSTTLYTAATHRSAGSAGSGGSGGRPTLRATHVSSQQSGVQVGMAQRDSWPTQAGPRAAGASGHDAAGSARPYASSTASGPALALDSMRFTPGYGKALHAQPAPVHVHVALAAFHLLAAAFAAFFLGLALRRLDALAGRVRGNAYPPGTGSSSFMELRYWVLLSAVLLWVTSAAADVAQAASRGVPIALATWSMGILVVRDHWFYVVVTGAMVQLVFALLQSGSDLTTYHVSVGRAASWPYIIVYCALLVDTWATHHRSRGGPHVLIPVPLLIAQAMLVLYYGATIVYGSVTGDWVYSGQNSWPWWGYILLFMLGVGAFSLARGLTLAGLAVTNACTVRAALRSGAVKVERHIDYYRTVKGDRKRKLDVWSPAATPGPATRLRGTSDEGNAPVIVFVHGGMYRLGDRRDVRNIACAWAQQGFVVVTPSYRLLRPCHNRFPDPIVDVATAVRWTIDHVDQYGGNPRKVFLVGHSAGGHAVACLATSPKFLADAGVDRRQLLGVVPIGAARLDRAEGGLMSKVLCCCCPSAYPAGATASEKLQMRPIVDVRNMDRATAAAVPPMLLVHGSHEMHGVQRAHALFAAEARAAGVTCFTAALAGEAHMSETMRVGLSDDALTPVVLSWVRQRAEEA